MKQGLSKRGQLKRSLSLGLFLSSFTVFHPGRLAGGEVRGAHCTEPGLAGCQGEGPGRLPSFFLESKPGETRGSADMGGTAREGGRGVLGTPWFLTWEVWSPVVSHFALRWHRLFLAPRERGRFCDCKAARGHRGASRVPNSAGHASPTLSHSLVPLCSKQHRRPALSNPAAVSLMRLSSPRTWSVQTEMCREFGCTLGLKEGRKLSH